jgi:CBS domain-containing protein
MGLEQSLAEIEVTALETEGPVVLDAATPVREVINRMREQRTGCVLLTRGEKLAGIFTERDVLKKVLGTAGALDQAVEAFMSPDPVYLAENAPIRKAVFLMERGGFRVVPVVDADMRVVTWVRQRDIVRYLVEFFADQVLNLPPDPGQVAQSREGG